MPNPSPRKLSNIEMTVLGLAWLRGPCTIYAIMKELSMSASSYHKSRAGTTYAAAKRLISAGLLAQSDDEAVTITAAGIVGLKNWLTPPIPVADIAHSADLIRLRFFFFGVIDLDQRLAFIDNSLDGLRTFLEKCEVLVHENEAIGDYFGVLATLSTILETRARIEWLTIVREWVQNPLAQEKGWAEAALRGLPKA
ncbi:MAG: hypothetical protein K8R88_12785 [Armatimonadetes bacterium]|nr:hypothetical protein [Armatimonadota bacterium]